MYNCTCTAFRSVSEGNEQNLEVGEKSGGGGGGGTKRKLDLEVSLCRFTY